MEFVNNMNLLLGRHEGGMHYVMNMLIPLFSYIKLTMHMIDIRCESYSYIIADCQYY